MILNFKLKVFNLYLFVLLSTCLWSTNSYAVRDFNDVADVIYFLTPDTFAEKEKMGIAIMAVKDGALYYPPELAPRAWTRLSAVLLQYVVRGRDYEKLNKWEKRVMKVFSNRVSYLKYLYLPRENSSAPLVRIPIISVSCELSSRTLKFAQDEICQWMKQFGMDE